MPSGSSSYRINVCGSVAEPACKKSAVCRVTGSGSDLSASSFGISKAMTMDFKHDEDAVLMQYGGGDPCPSGRSAILGDYEDQALDLSLTQVLKTPRSKMDHHNDTRSSFLEVLAGFAK